ncbi:MAG: alpha/beta hydrolase [Gammaproteobacteria bacterium]|nr:alpha/beta hydrolase [Gammaproteobacteria bacterium]MBQ0840846.1 alpha/beta hydrolase [Gammaproteobacteria bacterium]
MVTTPTAATPPAVTESLQRLHDSLPVLRFEPESDTPSQQIPDAKSYLDHYKLAAINATAKTQHGTRHYLGKLSAAGYNVACQYWLPREAKGTVFVVHGYFDHSALYRHLFSYLLQRGYAVVTFDLPGHGLSDGERASIATFDHYVEAFDGLLAACANHLPQPWHAVGQSTGGAIVLKHLLEESDGQSLFQHIALLAPLLHTRNWATGRLTYRLLRHFISRIKRDFKANSGDAAFLNFLQHDEPLQSRHIPLEWVGSMKRWTEEFHDLPTNHKAMTIVQGDQDMTLDWRYNLNQLQQKLPNATIEIIADAQHHLVNEAEPLRNQTFAAMPF